MSRVPTPVEITSQRLNWLAAVEGFEPVRVVFEPVCFNKYKAEHVVATKMIMCERRARL
jgi:hypothetical protein